MPEHALDWPAIFDIWRTPENRTDARCARNLAEDIGAPYENVRQWIKNGAVPANYWRALVVAVARRARVHVTCEDLAAATERLRPPKLASEAA